MQSYICLSIYTHTYVNMYNTIIILLSHICYIYNNSDQAVVIILTLICL